MADPQRTPRTISEAGGGEAVPNFAVPHPEQVEDAIHDGAPAGLTFGDSELPVVSVAGGPPARLGGYSPDPGRAPQVSNLDDPRGLQSHRAPSGVQR
jgi:hypothetical protein